MRGIENIDIHMENKKTTDKHLLRLNERIKHPG